MGTATELHNRTCKSPPSAPPILADLRKLRKRLSEGVGDILYFYLYYPFVLSVEDVSKIMKSQAPLWDGIPLCYNAAKKESISCLLTRKVGISRIGVSFQGKEKFSSPSSPSGSIEWGRERDMVGIEWIRKACTGYLISQGVPRSMVLYL